METIETELISISTKHNILHLPQGWHLTKLDEVAKRGTGHTPDKEKPEYYNGGIKWVSLADSNKLDNLYINKTTIEISSEGIRKSSAVLHPPGTVILSRDAGVGKSAIISESMAVIQHFVTWTCGDNIDAVYLYYKLQELKPLFERIAVGSTIKTIGLPFFKKLSIPLPPIFQQRKIATILSTWDEAIQTAGHLLKAKQLRKRGLMQQLLTGQQRLPGFSGEWREVKLGEVFQRVQRTNRPDVEAVLSISAKKGFVSQTEKFSRVIAGENLTNYTLLKKGEFAYNKGNSDLYPCGCIYKLDSYNEAAVPNVYFCFKSRGDVEEEFYKFYFQNRSLDRQLHQRINSGVRNDGLLNLNANEFFEVKIVYPPLDEQRAIATVLNATDEEIRLATAEVEVLKQQKRGLMQELLTGKTLVKVEGEEHQSDLLKSSPV